MEDLWRVTLKEFRNRAFVSVREGEVGAWQAGRDSGSAIDRDV